VLSIVTNLVVLGFFKYFNFFADSALAHTLLGGCEVVVRVFFARNMSGRFEYGYHPTAGVVEREDGTVQLVRAGGRRFHPQRFTARRPDGTFHVMVVGDSVPRGPRARQARPMRAAQPPRAVPHSTRSPGTLRSAASRIAR